MANKIELGKSRRPCSKCGVIIQFVIVNDKIWTPIEDGSFNGSTFVQHYCKEEKCRT